MESLDHVPSGTGFEKTLAAVGDHQRVAPWILEDSAHTDTNLEGALEEPYSGLHEPLHSSRHCFHGQVRLYGALVGMQDKLRLAVRQSEPCRIYRVPDKFVPELAFGEGERRV